MSPFRRRRRTVAERTEVAPPPRRRVVDEEVVAPPRRRPPRLWPWLLLLLLLVLAGLGALYFLSQADEDKETVPAVVGLSVDDATERLTADGFRTVVERRASVRPRGRVFAQRPGGGSQLDEGEAVTILVSRGRELVTVPSVERLRVEEAESRLRQANLTARRRGVFSEQPVGVVVAQDPRGGERVARDTTVRINVSKGTGRVAVPDVVGQQAAAAGANLRKVGLRPRVFNVPSPEPEGTVVAQNPLPGGELAKGDFVRINVSTGEPAGGGTDTGTDTGTTGGVAGARRVSVPETVGQSLNAAQDRLQRARLVARVDFVPSQEPAGRVVAQNPVAGTSVRPGASVRLNVSEGPAPGTRMAVPDVVGLREQEARRELTASGFRVRVLREPTPDPAEEGVVVRQEPQAGRRAPRGAQITIYVGEPVA